MENFKNSIHKKLKNFLEKVNSLCQRYRKNAPQIKIVFVTKYLEAEQFVMFLDIVQQFDIGSLYIGENRVQEAEKKIKYVKEKNPNLRQAFKFIMVGTLQKNKINKAISIFDEIHSVDSLSLAYALDKRLKRAGKIMPVFLEVNVSSEETKRGVKTEEADEAILKIKKLANLEIEGLMTIAPFVSNPEKVRPIFKKLKKLADKHHLLTSMGMSNDWQVAVEEGADVIRIGRVIFSQTR